LGEVSVDLADLVVEDAVAGLFRVHRSAMTSTEILRLEQERIFGSSWLYVGHDSEVPEPGDYRRRLVAGRPLIFVRGRDNVIRILINSCLHRGALVCRTDSGNANTFQCFYHGWSYDTRGRLIGVPDAEGYSAEFNKREQSLVSPPHVDSYRGMYFVNFGASVRSLSDYFGNARELIDLTMDSAEPLGGWKIVKGTAKFKIRANWKLLAENSTDNYHFRTVHRSYTDYLTDRRERTGMPAPSVNRITNSRSMALDNGHVAMLTHSVGRAIANPSPVWSEEAAAEARRMRDELVKMYGEERGLQMATISRFLIIFPNHAFQDTQSGFRMRQWWPTSPGEMEVNQWEFVPRGERDDVTAYRLEGAAMFLGPGGFGTPDDIEALESCQIGFGAPEVEWSDISRGMKRAPRSDDELAARGFWRQWHALIQGLGGAARTGDLTMPETSHHKLEVRA
jgi:p-cumate 2,3-dioxygenase subunit alpha